ncbi:YifB family Mg chelatase-like AAA ATPase [Leekyejoonella antrihumi]|uniref:ATP-binding protein n=1 Tax=Leekyejoonella antrihumi TaxID=1660198 RepID=A0A563E023_9MICO|nr:YifB family Mg chelatase-like AAA ATPase [Leekyejoonella antrihumi]TWP35561.1 ATP-binding protein [Leekyejoonella antrihumi]
MTLGRTKSVAVNGIDGRVVQVESDVSSGLPAFVITGMPDTACRQSPERIRAAFANSELQLPKQHITVNLSPAALPKHGSGFDLAIAIAVLISAKVVDATLAREVVHLGELGLDGSIRSVTGVLPAVVAAAEAGVPQVVVPMANAAEASLVPDVEVIPMASLADLARRYDLLRRHQPVPEPDLPAPQYRQEQHGPDLADVAGQEEARHAIEVAAAGGHHMAMVGPPGVGKTMIAERLAGLLPLLDRREALEVTAIHSVLGALTDDVLVERPPFVAPHHGTTMAAVVGGGSGNVRPGAASRAHRGVLFLDEAPEFKRDVLDALRQPLESGFIEVARARGTVRYPAVFQLVLAANPCPCGRNYGKGASCTCSPVLRRGYLSKLSGPLLDRVDVHLQMHPVTRLTLAGSKGESTATVAERVLAARRRQEARWKHSRWRLNSQVPGPVLRRGEWMLPGAVTRDLSLALETGALTLRGYDRCLRLAWTVADLRGVERPGPDELGEALCLRTSQVAA